MPDIDLSSQVLVISVVSSTKPATLHADTTSFVAYNSEESEPSFSIVFFNVFHNVNTLPK